MIPQVSSTFKLGLNLVAICLFFPSLVLAQTPASKRASYPPKFSIDYLKSCTNSAQAQNISAPKAQKYCSCTLNQIQATYSFQEIAQLKTQIEKSNKVPTSLNEIISSCSETFKK